MALNEDLKNKIKIYAKDKYEIEDTSIVPDADNPRLTFGNNGLKGEYAFLFVDIRKSSKLIENYGYQKAAKILQSFHDVCVRVIISNNGEVRSFDGDRVMGVFVGNYKNNNAVKAGQEILYGIRGILNPTLETTINCGVGIDFGTALITKVGKGANTNNNDIIWIGKATNYASHLCNEAENCLIVSEETYNKLDDTRKLNDGANIWHRKQLPLKTGNSIACYTTSWGWEIK